MPGASTQTVPHHDEHKKGPPSFNEGQGGFLNTPITPFPLIVCLFVTKGPRDSKLLCGPTTVIEGKERRDVIEREEGRLIKRTAEKARTESAS